MKLLTLITLLFGIFAVFAAAAPKGRGGRYWEEDDDDDFSIFNPDTWFDDHDDAPSTPVLSSPPPSSPPEPSMNELASAYQQCYEHWFNCMTSNDAIKISDVLFGLCNYRTYNWRSSCKQFGFNGSMLVTGPPANIPWPKYNFAESAASQLLARSPKESSSSHPEIPRPPPIRPGISAPLLPFTKEDCDDFNRIPRTPLSRATADCLQSLKDDRRYDKVAKPLCELRTGAWGARCGKFGYGEVVYPVPIWPGNKGDSGSIGSLPEKDADTPGDAAIESRAVEELTSLACQSAYDECKKSSICKADSKDCDNRCVCVVGLLDTTCVEHGYGACI